MSPGEGWKYVLSHDVLAALVEILSGEKFESNVKSHIFDPLGMEHSTFAHPIEDWEDFARQYSYNAKTGQFMPLYSHVCHLGTEYVSGGGGCVSTVEDYNKFLEALRVGDVILKKQTVAMIAENRLTEQQWATYSGRFSSM